VPAHRTPETLLSGQAARNYCPRPLAGRALRPSHHRARCPDHGQLARPGASSFFEGDARMRAGDGDSRRVLPGRKSLAQTGVPTSRPERSSSPCALCSSSSCLHQAASEGTGWGAGICPQAPASRHDIVERPRPRFGYCACLADSCCFFSFDRDVWTAWPQRTKKLAGPRHIASRDQPTKPPRPRPVLPNIVTAFLIEESCLTLSTFLRL